MTDGAWVRIGCEEADALRAGPQVGVLASFTDIDGNYGPPRISTEWGDRDSETPVLRDGRWPNRDGSRPDTKPCGHWKFVPSNGSRWTPEVEAVVKAQLAPYAATGSTFFDADVDTATQRVLTALADRGLLADLPDPTTRR